MVDDEEIEAVERGAVGVPEAIAHLLIDRRPRIGRDDLRDRRRPTDDPHLPGEAPRVHAVPEAGEDVLRVEKKPDVRGEVKDVQWLAAPGSFSAETRSKAAALTIVAMGQMKLC